MRPRMSGRFVEYIQLLSLLNSLHAIRMDDVREIVGRNLRRLRNAKGWSQEELAFRAEVDRSYISLLETANYSASVTMIAKLAKALGVEPADLLRP